MGVVWLRQTTFYAVWDVHSLVYAILEDIEQKCASLAPEARQLETLPRTLGHSSRCKLVKGGVNSGGDGALVCMFER
jgi:hypothetical protein